MPTLMRKKPSGFGIGDLYRPHASHLKQFYKALDHVVATLWRDVLQYDLRIDEIEAPGDIAQGIVVLDQRRIRDILVCQELLAQFQHPRSDVYPDRFGGQTGYRDQQASDPAAEVEAARRAKVR